MNGQNNASWIISQYFDRKVFKDLGYTDDIDNLTDFDAECFRLIETEFSKLKAAEHKKRMGEMKRRGRGSRGRR